MYSSSRTWVSPRVKETGQRQQLNFARRKLCPKSPFWLPDFDIAKHKKDWEAGEARRAEQKEVQEMEEEEERKKLQDSESAESPPIRTPFAGKDLNANFSPVLCVETIFCPQWEKGQTAVAPWPSKSEMKYEGDDRISTDALHGRFPGIPRVESNETVNWQHRAPVGQYLFDEFYYPVPQAVDIFLRTHWVPELEISDGEGEKAIGKELMDMLDPQDQW